MPACGCTRTQTREASFIPKLDLSKAESFRGDAADWLSSEVFWESLKEELSHFLSPLFSKNKEARKISGGPFCCRCELGKRAVHS